MAKQQKHIITESTPSDVKQTAIKNVDLQQHDDVQNNHYKDESAPQELHIVIQRHKQLYDTLKSRKRVMNAGCLLTIFLVVLFACFTALSIAIKDKIPYKTIMSNEYGVFEMRNEKADQFYFLFNTAELWGNSGIKVHRGERIIIKASGKFNTEVRHMAFKDSIISWIDANGRPAERSPNKNRDMYLYRNHYMIYSDAEPECLLAMIVNDDQSLSNWQSYDINYKDFMPTGNIKAIGTNCEFIAEEDGFLHFAVNDVVFTDSIVDLLLIKEQYNPILNDLRETVKSVRDTINKKETNPADRDRKKRIGLERMWYNDNVGSFLIFVERLRVQDKSE